MKTEHLAISCLIDSICYIKCISTQSPSIPHLYLYYTACIIMCCSCVYSHWCMYCVWSCYCRLRQYCEWMQQHEQWGLWSEVCRHQLQLHVLLWPGLWAWPAQQKGVQWWVCCLVTHPYLELGIENNKMASCSTQYTDVCNMATSMDFVVVLLSICHLSSLAQFDLLTNSCTSQLVASAGYLA